MRKSALTSVALAALTTVLLSSDAHAVTLTGPDRHDGLLDCLSSTGGQWFDLGIKLSSSMKVTVVFAQKKATTSSRGLFGARTAASERNFSAGVDTKGFFADCNNANYATYRLGQTPLTLNEKYQVEVSSAERILKRFSDGAIVDSSTTYSTNVFTTSKNAYLFQVNGSGNWGWGEFKVYSLTITSALSGLVLRDYVPCSVNGKGCLFERITGKIFTPNAGADKEIRGTEIADSVPPTLTPAARSAVLGLKVSDLATEEAPVNVYSLYSPANWAPSATNNFIGMSFAARETNKPNVDLGYALTRDMSFDLTFSITATEKCNNTHGVFGSRESASVNNIGVLFYGKQWSDEKEYIHLDFNNSNYADYRVTYTNSSVRNTPFRAFLSAERRVLMNALTGEVLGSNTNVCHDTITTKSAHFFGMNCEFKRYCSMKFYALTVRQGGKVIHDYRPLTVNGVTGLYDLVSLTLVKDAGAAEFCAGSAVPVALRTLEGVAADGRYETTIPYRKLTPETPYYYGFLATGGTGRGYALWGCDYPRTFTTTEKVPTGLSVLLK